MIKNLKCLRNEYNITQQKLADILQTSQQSVNKYENHCVEPDIETLIKIADTFGVSVDYLIGRTNNREFNSTINMSDLKQQELSLLKNFRLLTEKQKKCILTLIESYID